MGGPKGDPRCLAMLGIMGAADDIPEICILRDNHCKMCIRDRRYLKEHGKGRAACYEALPPEGQLHPQAHLISAIDRPEGVREDLPAFALELLGKARWLDEAIYLLLARIGRQLSLIHICANQ